MLRVFSPNIWESSVRWHWEELRGVKADLATHKPENTTDKNHSNNLHSQALQNANVCTSGKFNLLWLVWLLLPNHLAILKRKGKKINKRCGKKNKPVPEYRVMALKDRHPNPFLFFFNKDGVYTRYVCNKPYLHDDRLLLHRIHLGYLKMNPPQSLTPLFP